MVPPVNKNKKIPQLVQCFRAFSLKRASRRTGLLVLLAVAGVLLAGIFILLPRNVPVWVSYDEGAALRDMLALRDIGPRVAGSEAERQTAEYSAEVFRKAGLRNVHIEEYEQTLYEVNHARMWLLTRDPLSASWKVKELRHLYDFYLTSYSGSTPGRTRYEVVTVGHGTDEDYEGRDTSGKAVLQVKTGASQWQLGQACRHGAAVNIMQNLHHGAHLGYPAYQAGTYASDPNKKGIRTYPDDNPDCLIPSLVVSRDVGDEIWAAVNSSRDIPLVGPSVYIELDFDVTIERRFLRVAVGDLVGEKHPEEVVMFGAHHDTPYGTMGASDNGGGTVTVLSLARALSGYRTERTIRFSTLGGEEEGTLGSQNYVAAHITGPADGKGGGERFVHFVNFDVNGINLRYGNTLTLISSDNRTLSRLEDIYENYRKKDPELWDKYEVSFSYDRYPGVDARAFALAGVPSSWAVGVCPNLHTVYDRVYNTYDGSGEMEVNPESWGLSVRLFGTYALLLAGPEGP